MANKSQIAIKFKVGGETKSLNASYYNWVKEDKQKVIAKVGEKVVTERVVGTEALLVEGNKVAKSVVDQEKTVVKKWVDVDGHIYEKSDIKFYDWEGKQIIENQKTIVFAPTVKMSLSEFLTTYAPDGYYYVEPLEEKDDKNSYDLEWELHIKPVQDGVLVGDFNLSSKGFNRSIAGLRSLGKNKFELMVAKSKKAIQD